MVEKGGSVRWSSTGQKMVKNTVFLNKFRGPEMVSFFDGQKKKLTDPFSNNISRFESVNFLYPPIGGGQLCPPLGGGAKIQLAGCHWPFTWRARHRVRIILPGATQHRGADERAEN